MLGDLPKRRDRLPFLRLDDRESGEFEPDASAIPCCGGDGTRFEPKDGTVFRCGVRQRLNRLQEVYAQLLRIEEAKADLSRPSELVREGLSSATVRLQENLSSVSQKGLHFERRDAAILADLCLFAAWQKGARIQILNFASLQGLGIPALSLSSTVQKAADEPGNPGFELLFLFNVDALWSPEKLEIFDFILSYCYRSRIPLWFEGPLSLDAKGSAAPSEGGSLFRPGAPRRHRPSVSERVEQLKNRPLRALLGPRTAMRLDEVSEAFRSPKKRG